MTWRPFVLAMVLPLAFTVVVLVGVQRNRQAERAPIELSEREITLNTGTDENSGATAWLTWSEPRAPWLSRAQLEALGFDLSVDPASPGADRAYARQLQRRAYVVLLLGENQLSRSRLVPVDAGPDPARLLSEYPNGRTHIVTAGVVGIRRNLAPGIGADVLGYLVNIDPRGIHVPTELANRLPARGTRAASFTIAIRYGARLEPWIVDVR